MASEFTSIKSYRLNLICSVAGSGVCKLSPCHSLTLSGTLTDQSGKNCRFTALHRQLAPLALDHIGSRPFFMGQNYCIYFPSTSTS